MSNFLRRSTEIFENARQFKAIRHQLPGFSPVEELYNEVSRISRLLHDTQDESAASIRYQVWRLRSTIELSLLPYDDEDLSLPEQIEGLESLVSYFPVLIKPFERIKEIILFLMENPENPKRKAVFRLLNEADEKVRRIGLVSALTRWTIPGWSNRLWLEIEHMTRKCSRISSVNILKNNSFDLIILPSGGKYSSLTYDLFHGYRAPRIDLVFYRHEPLRIPEIRKLPPGSYTVRSEECPEIPENSSELYQVDEWVEKHFWEKIRDGALRESFSGVSPEIRHILVNARLVLLANRAKVFLGEDRKVIEISEILEGGRDLKKFPRCRVSQLKAGALIVLRTSGSGEYLDDVANSLMEAKGRGDLIETALNWKKVLLSALTTYGSELIAERLKDRGHGIRDHRYIWMWTTDQVIRPESRELFMSLISIMEELDFNLPNNDPVRYANEKWQQMRELIHFRRVAGQKIRAVLLERLRQIIEEGISIEDEYHLALSGLSAGELTVFRVTGIDDRTLEVPYSRIGLISDME